ncbi:hypothetical protein M5689_004095 [Euphorbia peplus]|nr:hypothetical protein M5689_004095 [Euphorbia peplus]
MVKPIVKSLICCIFCMVILCTSVLAQGEETWCTKEASFEGKCDDEADPCIKDFIGKFGANSKPKDCICKTLSPQAISLYRRYCSCQVVC